MFGLKRKSVIYMSISDHEWAQFMSKQIVLAISMQIFDGFYKTSWSRPDTRLNDRLFARILKYVRHAIVWSLKFTWLTGLAESTLAENLIVDSLIKCSCLKQYFEQCESYLLKIWSIWGPL